jgi:hypothetical protein
VGECIISIRLSRALVLACIVLPGVSGCQHALMCGAAKNIEPYSAHLPAQSVCGGKAATIQTPSGEDWALWVRAR